MIFLEGYKNCFNEISLALRGVGKFRLHVTSHFNRSIKILKTFFNYLLDFETGKKPLETGGNRRKPVESSRGRPANGRQHVSRLNGWNAKIVRKPNYLPNIKNQKET